MKLKNNKTCIVCGKKYTFCTGCSEFDKYPRWMGIFDTETCMNVYDITSDFRYGHKTADEALEALEECDLSNKGNFNEVIKSDVEKILAEGKKVIKKK